MTKLGLLLVASALTACTAADSAAPPTLDEIRDVATDDIADDKTDAATPPVGLYQLTEGQDFEEGWPRQEFLDLRSDGTYYVYEIGPVLSEGNFEEGYSSYFGTYSFTRDGHGNRYLRVKPDDAVKGWRDKYTFEAGVLAFYYANGDVGWRMELGSQVTPDERARVREVIDAGTNRRRFTTRAKAHPDAVWARYYGVDVREDHELFTVNVDGVVRYAIQGPDRIEVFSKTNQLLARGTDATFAAGANGWTWTEL